MRNQPPPVPPSMPKFVHRYRPRTVVNRRPRLELQGSSATPEEAAAVMAAVEQFLRDTAPPPAPEPQTQPMGRRRPGARPSTTSRNRSKYLESDLDLVLWRDAPGLPREPGGPRGRPGPHHPDPPARVRRLRQRGGEVPRRRDRGDRVHRLPPQAGRLRPAPGRRPDGPREAAVRRRHAGADGDVRGRGREVRAAQQGPHHHAPEHPDPPHPAARRGRADPRDLRRRALQPRGLRQHRAQRDRRPVGRRLPRRALRPDAVRGRVRALLRAPPHDAADAAQGQDRVHRAPTPTAR